MSIFEREAGRLSSPVRLRSRFARGGILYNPVEFDRVEIWKFHEGEPAGGILVDVIDGSHVIQDDTGIFFVLYDPFVEGSSPFSPAPGAQGPGSPGQSPNSPTAILPNVRYYDKWYYKPDSSSILIDTVGLTFFLYPDEHFVDGQYTKYRFEQKEDRKQVVRGEDLDMRLKIIPVPLHQESRQPLVRFVIPILTMTGRVLDDGRREVIAPFEIPFTGKEGVVPTKAIGVLPLGMYRFETTLDIPSGQKIVFRQFTFNVVD
jgi:hypothetical protein